MPDALRSTMRSFVGALVLSLLSSTTTRAQVSPFPGVTRAPYRRSDPWVGSYTLEASASVARSSPACSSIYRSHLSDRSERFGIA